MTQRPAGGARSFGEALRAAREARGLSLDEVAETTRVARHHLAALEANDLDALPAGPFARGYIEAYGKAVGIDPGPLIEAYRVEARRRAAATPEAEGRSFDEFARIVKQRAGGTADPVSGLPRWSALLAGSGVVGVLAVGAWLVLRAPASSPALAPVAREPQATPRSASPPATAARSQPETAPVAPTEAPTPPRPNQDILIPDSGVGAGVVNHQLVGSAAAFPEGTEVVFWTRVVGGRKGDVVDHVWLHEGRGVARIPLRIEGSPWRTFSRRPLPPGSAGRWTAEARAVDGRLLARQEFACVPRDR